MRIDCFLCERKTSRSLWFVQLTLIVGTEDSMKRKCWKQKSCGTEELRLRATMITGHGLKVCENTSSRTVLRRGLGGGESAKKYRASAAPPLLTKKRRQDTRENGPMRYEP